MSGSRNDETIAPPPDTQRDNEQPCPIATAHQSNVDVGTQVVSRLLNDAVAPILLELQNMHREHDAERKKFMRALNAVLEDNELKRKLILKIDRLEERQKVDRQDINLNRTDIDRLLDGSGLSPST